jgi:hypothetical protein
MTHQQWIIGIVGWVVILTIIYCSISEKEKTCKWERLFSCSYERPPRR